MRATRVGGGLENRHLVRSGADVSATVCATVVAFYRVTVKHFRACYGFLLSYGRVAVRQSRSTAEYRHPRRMDDVSFVSAPTSASRVGCNLQAIPT